MVEVPLGNVFKDVLMLFVDDLFDCVSQCGAVKEICVVCAPRGQDLPRPIDDGFNVMGARSLVLCLDKERQTIVFDGGVLSGHCLNFVLRTSSVTRSPADGYLFPAHSVRKFERREHSPYFVVRGTGFLCFIFFVAREEEDKKARGFDRLNVIDKVMQGGIIG